MTPPGGDTRHIVTTLAGASLDGLHDVDVVDSVWVDFNNRAAYCER